MTPNPVLAGIDGSPASAAAVRWAAEDAARRGVPLRLIHAREWLDDIHAYPGQLSEVRALIERMLAETADRVRERHPGLTVATEVLTYGGPADALLAAVGDGELLVLGSRGLGGFTGMLVGSVALASAARCDVPVVLVPPGEAERRTGPDAPEVVVGVDTRAPSDAVLDFAFRQARLRGATVRAVHGWMPPPVWGYAGWVTPQLETARFRAIEAELLDQALTGRREKYPEVALVEDSRIGTGAGALVDISADAALVVVGRRRRPHQVGMRLGPVAHAVVHHAQAPVAVVPHD